MVVVVVVVDDVVVLPAAVPVVGAAGRWLLGGSGRCRSTPAAAPQAAAVSGKNQAPCTPAQALAPQGEAKPGLRGAATEKTWVIYKHFSPPDDLVCVGEEVTENNLKSNLK